MKLKKEYTYTNNRQIWRLIPAEPGNLIIEERNPETKEVFFNCIEIESGKKIFYGFQFEEKFWIGIESVAGNIIYFNQYLKPDMPQHKGIIAFDINNKKIIWENPDLIFLFITGGQLVCYIQKFEGRKFFILNRYTGELVEELGGDASQVNILRNTIENSAFSDVEYLFPERFYDTLTGDILMDKVLTNFKTENVVIGQIEFIRYENIILMNSFEPNDAGMLNNIFRAIEIESGKVILEEVLNNNSHAVVPDSFFMKKKSIFILKEKTKLLVYSVRK